ncbi:MAG: DUF1552 domain-containing protein [Verrucomicrobiales bacterium]|nr:DUF1552 domain-containing protein [Verrucomicrobiales bacterium]
MKIDRRKFLASMGGAMALPSLECLGGAAEAAKTRCLIVANPLGMHPAHFFPKQYGKNFDLPSTLRSLDWLKDRLSIFSHTDHNMVNGHGREVAFLNGILPTDAGPFPEKNISFDQWMARQSGSEVRFPSINAALQDGIEMSWTANGVKDAVITDPQRLFDHLFLNSSKQQKKRQMDLIDRNHSVLDRVADQFAFLEKSASGFDHERLDQFQTSVREFEKTLESRRAWIGKDKPNFDISGHYADVEPTLVHDYNAIFDMITYAFETDLTRVATVAFPRTVDYTAIAPVTRSYHSATHNGKVPAITAELVAIETFQVEQLSRCLQKMDSIQEPNGEGSMLDNTIVLFGSGMGYGGTHSCRNLPIMVAGGGFQHQGHINAATNGKNLPLCNLFVTLLQRFGLEVDTFNTSTGKFDLRYS